MPSADTQDLTGAPAWPYRAGVRRNSPWLLSAAPIAPGIVWGWVQIAAYLGVSTWRARHWHYGRPMPVSRLGRRVAVPKLALDHWIMTAPRTSTLRVRGQAEQKQQAQSAA